MRALSWREQPLGRGRGVASGVDDEAAVDVSPSRGDGDAGLADPAGDGLEPADQRERLVDLLEALGELGLRARAGRWMR